MGCAYIYKGNKFNSELELDDFLLLKKPFEPEYGDLVFSLSNMQLTLDQKLKEIRQKSRELDEKYEEWIRNNKIEIGEDGETSIVAPPYIGVNKFLSTHQTLEGGQLYPEFRADEYWKRRFDDWKQGKFNEIEIQEFGFDPANLPTIMDESEQNRMRDQMTVRWKTQAKIGDAIHNIMQITFSKHGENYGVQLPNEVLKNIIKSKLLNKNKPYIKDDSIIDQAIQYAKSLYEKLKQESADGDLTFYPEFRMSQSTSETDSNGGPIKLYGIIDLLVIDSKGNAHIIDYKTSIHDYLGFSDSKIYAYSYQLAVYQRMLEKNGLTCSQFRRWIAPIQMQGFRKEGNTYTYNQLNTRTPIQEQTESTVPKKMWSNIEEFLPEEFKIVTSAEDVVKTTTEQMSKWFPDYNRDKAITKEEVIDELKRRDKLTPDDKGFYTYKTDEEIITSDDEAQFVEKVFNWKKTLPGKRARTMKEVKSALNKAIEAKNIDNIQFPEPIINNQEGSTYWLKDTLRRYADGSWEIVDNTVTESFGILTLKNNITNQIDFIRVSTRNLTAHHLLYAKDGRSKLVMHRGLTGNFESDSQAQSKSGQLMAEAVDGNIELIETMLVINQLQGLQNVTVGNISVINPWYTNAIQMSNEQLYYCFDELCKYSDVPKNNFKDGSIKLASNYELAAQMFKSIMMRGHQVDFKDEYRHFKNLNECVTLLDDNLDKSKEEKIAALEKLLTFMTSSKSGMSNKLKKTYTSQHDLQDLEVSMYNTILMAIAELKGINFKQQLKDHDKWLESLSILRKGASGSYLDNPGKLSSETLNLITKLVNNAYQNTREDVQRHAAKIRQLTENLKKEKGINSLNENFANQTNMYKNMYKWVDGDLYFIRPEEAHSQAEKEFLEYTLDIINRNRYPYSDAQLARMKASGDPKYYRIPLAQGGTDSIATENGLLNLLKAKLSFLLPKTAWRRAQEKVEGIFNYTDNEDEARNKSQILFQMANLFDEGESETRVDKLKRMKANHEAPELNFESLLYKHIFAHSVKENIDDVFPLIKTAMIHIQQQGANQNTSFSGDLDYLQDYINGKIKNQSIVNPKNKKWIKVASLIKQQASLLTLAFAPVQMVYQPLQGLWQEISLMIRKPGGNEAFSFKNFVKANRIVWTDLFKNTTKHPTICSMLNQHYGINDMDMNMYANRITHTKKGIWDFTNMAFKFASRPDYYNRMVILVSQMIQDGSYQAHSIVNGELHYDYRLDERFKAYTNNDRTDIQKYNKAKSLYYTIAQQLIEEKTKNPDGSLFKYGDPLPKPYTTKEMENFKSLSDDIYGYYSHEKKSMIMSTALGSLWLQFKTFWSGKKNQYLEAGGTKVTGKWDHLKVDGKKQYYQLNANGEILFDQPYTDTPTSAPVYQWEGQWQEGILLTISDIVKDCVQNKSFSSGFKNKWNEEDINLRNTYRSNMKQFVYDFMMFVVIGSILGAAMAGWFEDEEKELKDDRSISAGLWLASLKVMSSAIKNSFLDLNFIDSIGSPISQWTPFSVEWSGRQLTNLYEVALGDRTFEQGICNLFGGAKQVKPMLDRIFPEPEK